MNPLHPLYWDASAVISLLLADPHTRTARQAAHPNGIHFLSSLTVAEVLSVLSRRGGDDIAVLREEFARELDEGKWSFDLRGPSTKTMKLLSPHHPLRGADLWHLAKALELREEIPELRLITFDRALEAACQKEGILFEP